MKETRGVVKVKTVVWEWIVYSLKLLPLKHWDLCLWNVLNSLLFKMQELWRKLGTSLEQLLLQVRTLWYRSWYLNLNFVNLNETGVSFLSPPLISGLGCEIWRTSWHLRVFITYESLSFLVIVHAWASTITSSQKMHKGRKTFTAKEGVKQFVKCCKWVRALVRIWLLLWALAFGLLGHSFVCVCACRKGEA